MTRAQLEHLIRAAADIADDTDIVVFGSQAILGQFPDAPEALRISMEADLFPLHHPERSEVIDGTIGELSPFHETFGYYAHGIGEEAVRLPQGWKERLVVVRNENTRGVTGLCLEIHDLLAAKTVALRDKDFAFLREAARHRLADRDTLLQRLATVEVETEVRKAARAAVLRAFQEAAGSTSP